MHKIAVILTCFNRCKSTVTALRSLFASCNEYNSTHAETLELTVFLTDDGCTDGTSAEVREQFPDEQITILQGDGSLYWAGGMRFAWRESLKSKNQWDYYLLLNDDTYCLPDAFAQLLEAQQYMCATDGKPGVCSGVCRECNSDVVTYGAEYYSHPVWGKSLFMKPTGKPAPCDRTNANLLLIASEVVDNVGIFDEVYRHSCADWDYGLKAKKAGYPVYITAKVAARCDFDHDLLAQESSKVLNMSLRQRKEFFNHPLRCTSDKLNFMWRHYKLKFFMLYVARTMAVYCPGFYYRLLNLRPQNH